MWHCSEEAPRECSVMLLASYFSVDNQYFLKVMSFFADFLHILCQLFLNCCRSQVCAFEVPAFRLIFRLWIDLRGAPGEPAAARQWPGDSPTADMTPQKSLCQNLAENHRISSDVHLHIQTGSANS